jgi:hypothetical protein
MSVENSLSFDDWSSIFQKNTLIAIQHQVGDWDSACKFATELCDDVYEFLSLLPKAGYCKDDTEYKILCQRIYSSLNCIKFLPQGSGLYGNCESGCVQINRDLSEDERKLYIFHELAHILTQIHEIIDASIDDYINGSLKHSHMYGYQIIDEAMVQDMAENLFHISKGSVRPSLHSEYDEILNISIQTNFGFYGLYQPIANAFAQSLRGMSNIHDMCKFALYNNFYKHIIDEYRRDGVEDRLDEILSKMGNIWYAKYRSFGGEYRQEHIYRKGAAVEVVSEFVTDKEIITGFYEEVCNELSGPLADSRGML